MGQAETKEGKRSSVGSNQSPISPQAAHHPNDQRASTPTPSLMNSLDRTKQRTRRASHEETIKDGKIIKEKSVKLMYFISRVFLPWIFF